MTVTLTVLNTALILAVTGLAVLLWIDGGITVGAIAVAIGLIIRLTQMSGWILRTVTSLFENIGTVQNGIDTISQSYTVTDRPGAAELEVTAGEVRFEDIGFHYGRSEEHTSELQSLMRISYAVFCLKKKKYTTHT